MSATNGNTTEDDALCPACERPSTVRELGDHRGTCHHCAVSFRMAHRSWIEGKTHQREESFEHVVEQTRDPFTRDDMAPFDLEAVERALGEFEATPEDSRADAAELVARIMGWCWSATNIRSAFARFAVLSRGLRPDLCTLNFSQIAHALNTTKQNTAKAVCMAEAFWGMKFRNGRAKAGRANMRTARMKNPVYRASNEHHTTKLP